MLQHTQAQSARISRQLKSCDLIPGNWDYMHKSKKFKEMGEYVMGSLAGFNTFLYNSPT